MAVPKTTTLLQEVCTRILPLFEVLSTTQAYSAPLYPAHLRLGQARLSRTLTCAASQPSQQARHRCTRRCLAQPQCSSCRPQGRCQGRYQVSRHRCVVCCCERCRAQGAHVADVAEQQQQLLQGGAGGPEGVEGHTGHKAGHGQWRRTACCWCWRLQLWCCLGSGHDTQVHKAPEKVAGQGRHHRSSRQGMHVSCVNSSTVVLDVSRALSKIPWTNVNYAAPAMGTGVMGIGLASRGSPSVVAVVIYCKLVCKQ